jgi:hypothetical protein
VLSKKCKRSLNPESWYIHVYVVLMCFVYLRVQSQYHGDDT